ncbi:DNA-processing protein DprA [Candidatus Palauibacter sp.]|uniref:DNA-processing protein DprA n=1 Tax=Candidatus Palauibacter sp. TaxID=3101350 RepID=UPI003C6EF5CB
MAPLERELLALIVLSRVPGLGFRTVRRLVDRYGGAAAALRAVRAAAPDELRRVCGRPIPTGKATRALGPAAVERAQGLLRAARAKGLGAVGYGGAAYPAGLRDLPDPPPVLFLRGSLPSDPDRAVAVVGTRAASSYGLRTAYTLGRELGRWGWTVVSGMARGIDAAAHAGALDAGGHSTGVLGTGHDHEYPAENRELYGRMRARGLLLSEFEPGAPPTRAAFPRRNRVIAALARGVIVVEAGGKSGALNTADHALDLGREVLAVPGRIDDPGAAGCLRLLRQGAGLVAGVQDVFDALGWLHVAADGGPGSGDDGGSTQSEGEAAASPDMELLRALTRGPRSPDELAVGLELPVARVLRGLGRLELEGWVERRPGGNFSAVRRPARR